MATRPRPAPARRPGPAEPAVATTPVLAPTAVGPVAAWLFDHHALGWIVTDRDLIVQCVTGDLGSIPGPGAETDLAPRPGQYLPDVVPELIGLEDRLRDVLDGTLPVFEIAGVQRPGPAESFRLVNLVHLPRQALGGAIVGLIHLVEDNPSLTPFLTAVNQRRAELEVARDQLAEQVMDLQFSQTELEAGYGHVRQLTAGVLQEAQAWLTRLMAHTELLAQGVAGELSPLQREAADHLVTCAAHLRQLYHDVVDILDAVGQPQQLVLEPTIVSAIVEGVAAQAAAAATERGHHLEVDIAAGPTLVLCDGQSIQRVLATLLAAAMAQAPRGSRLRVAANDDAAPGYVQLTVRVLGAVVEGSPAGAVEASAAAPPAPGLEVARMLVTAHGGTFSFGAAPDGQVHGWFTLPVIGFGELELAPVPTQRR